MCSEIYLEASRRQQKRRLRLVQRDTAFEHIAVEVHRTIQVGKEGGLWWRLWFGCCCWRKTGSRAAAWRSFTHLDVLTAPPVDDDLAEDADRILVAVTFRIGRLAGSRWWPNSPALNPAPSWCGSSTAKEPAASSKPTPPRWIPGADRRPRTAVLEAVIAHSDRTGFVQARKAGARPGVLSELSCYLSWYLKQVLAPILFTTTTNPPRPPSAASRCGPAFQPRAGQGLPQTHADTTPAQVHQPARRPGHHLRPPYAARPRHGSVHHDHHAHPCFSGGPSNYLASPTLTAWRRQYTQTTRPQLNIQPVTKQGTSG